MKLFKQFICKGEMRARFARLKCGLRPHNLKGAGGVPPAHMVALGCSFGFFWRTLKCKYKIPLKGIRGQKMQNTGIEYKKPRARFFVAV